MEQLMPLSKLWKKLCATPTRIDDIISTLPIYGDLLTALSKVPKNLWTYSQIDTASSGKGSGGCYEDWRKDNYSLSLGKEFRFELRNQLHFIYDDDGGIGMSSNWLPGELILPQMRVVFLSDISQQINNKSSQIYLDLVNSAYFKDRYNERDNPKAPCWIEIKKLSLQKVAESLESLINKPHT